jgi:hypothetical protein
MRFGVEPDRVRSYVPGNPARGKAQGRIDLPAAAGGCGSQMGVKAQKSSATPKTKSPADRLFEGCTPIRRSVHPDENKSGRTRGVEATCGPGRIEMSVHPSAGTNLRRAEEPRSAAGREMEGRRNGIARQGRGCPEHRVAEHRADKGRDGA